MVRIIKSLLKIRQELLIPLIIMKGVAIKERNKKIFWFSKGFLFLSITDVFTYNKEN